LFLACQHLKSGMILREFEDQNLCFVLKYVRYFSLPPGYTYPSLHTTASVQWMRGKNIKARHLYLLILVLSINFLLERTILTKRISVLVILKYLLGKNIAETIIILIIVKLFSVI
jgi:hypothetical protein